METKAKKNKKTNKNRTNVSYQRSNNDTKQNGGSIS